MTIKPHDRQYDVVVLGANGYTGKHIAQHISAHLPTTLKWALAGRSREKLEKVVAELKSSYPDRRQPDIETCELNVTELDVLAKRTFILVASVGPYALYGEHAFKACAENGTHYLDVTGEVVFTYDMIKKYEGVARATGSLMFPQIGLESAPADLVTWSLASLIRSNLHCQVRDVVVSLHEIGAVFSGGTLGSVLTFFDTYSIQEIQTAYAPYALSPVPNSKPASQPTSLSARLTGVYNVPELGVMKTSLFGSTDMAIVHRTWGLLSVIPSRRNEFYGPNFSFQEYSRAKSWLEGFIFSWALAVAAPLVALLPPFRSVLRWLVFKKGEGTDLEEARKTNVEYRGVAVPDTESPTKTRAFCSARFQDGPYSFTGLLVAQAVHTLLENDLGLEGGVYTAACLGQAYIDRLDNSGFKFHVELRDI